MEITFFKKKYRRHTNFALELKEIPVEQQPSYGDRISFNLPTNGNLIYRCFIQVKLPVLQFTDSIIKNNKCLPFRCTSFNRHKI